MTSEDPVKRVAEIHERLVLGSDTEDSGLDTSELLEMVQEVSTKPRRNGDDELVRELEEILATIRPEQIANASMTDLLGLLADTPDGLGYKSELRRIATEHVLSDSTPETLQDIIRIATSDEETGKVSGSRYGLLVEAVMVIWRVAENHVDAMYGCADDLLDMRGRAVERTTRTISASDPDVSKPWATPSTDTEVDATIREYILLHRPLALRSVTGDLLDMFIRGELRLLFPQHLAELATVDPNHASEYVGPVLRDLEDDELDRYEPEPGRRTLRMCIAEMVDRCPEVVSDTDVRMDVDPEVRSLMYRWGNADRPMSRKSEIGLRTRMTTEEYMRFRRAAADRDECLAEAITEAVRMYRER